MKISFRFLFASMLGLLGSTLHAGNLTVTLTPAQAVSAGARWRVDGGSWRNSGATVNNLSNTTHAVDFKAISGWLTPAATNVSITSGNTTSLTATYVQPASLKITLTPSSGQWRIDGGAWQASGATATGLTPGNHAVDYAGVGGYASPSAETVALVANQTTSLARSYTQLAQLKVTLSPTTAQWRVDGGAWQASGVTVANLLPGAHTVDYNAVSGYITPASESVTLTSGQLTALTRSYVQLASITATLSPSWVMWRVDGGTIVNSGVTVGNLTPGSHTIDYFAQSGWAPPPLETVTLTPGQALTLSRSATQLAQLTVSYPVNAGYWRMNGGAWNGPTNGAIDIFPGTYTIEYSARAGWNAPPTETITATGGQSIVLNPAFVQLGGITVTLTPSSAQWNIDGNTWQPSGNSWSNLTPGVHTLNYSAVPGYMTPAPESVTIVSGQTLAVARTYVQTAQVTVTLTPASGQWRVDGGVWQNGGATLANLAPGAHSIDYAPLAGYTAPVSESVSLAAGQSLALTRSYIQLAQLIVTLTPASAQWSVDGGAWQNSGGTVANLSPGMHTIAYAALGGYTAPAGESVTLASGQSLALTRSYIQLAQLALTLSPATGTQWRVDNGAWQDSGATVANLTPGSHSVDYAALAGYTAPASESVSLSAGQSLSLTRAYIQLAQLSITLTPSSGQWRVDGGAWQASGATVANLAPGNHAVDYSSLTNYTSPPAETVALAAGQSLALTRSYVQLAQILIGLVPSSGQWRANGGPWQASGTSLFVPPGAYTIDYSALSFYDSPASENITLAAGGVFATTRYYTSQKPTLRINLTPTTGQWRLDSGAWQASGAQLTELDPGTHAIDYTDIGGDYALLASETIALALRDQITLARSYSLKPAALTVTLTPTTAQWRVDNGAWQASGATAANLAPGVHAIDYAPLSGYITPPAESATLAAGQSLALTRSYTQLAQLTVSLTPTSAQWRLDGGAWQNTSTTLNNLPLGAHTVDYSDVTGYITPASESISLVSGANTLTRNYTALASLNISLTPSSAQWRLDGGAWQYTSTTLNSLPLGAHTIDYSAVTGYITPPSESISLVSGPNTLSRSYTALASFSVSLTPTNAQWRLDGGAWQFTSTTLNNLPLGSHAVDYIDVTGYIAPPPETVTLVSGPNSLSRTYTPLASLAITLTPNSAQWRLDGGLWQYTSTTLNNLSLGAHAIDYSDVTGYITPASESVTLNSGQNLVLTRIYTQLASLNIALTPNTAQWRLDGGAWQFTSTTLNNLALGSHAIDYSAVSGYITPASESVTLVSGANSLTRTYASAGPAYAIVKDFSDAGVTPAIVRGSDGAFYVATSTGGSNGGGQVFRLNADGSGYAIVKAFISATNAAWTPNSLTEGSDHVLYGTTFSGGVNTNNGTVFKINKDGTGYAILHSFDSTSTASIPNSLLEGSDGLLYGTTQFGGMGGYIFHLNKDGTGFGIVTNAYSSKSLIEGPGGAIYATTAAGTFGGAGGSLFKVNKDGSGFAVLKNLDGSAEGSAPKSVLLLGSDGVLYGTTSAGGTANKGVVYRLNADGSGFAVLRSFLGNATDGGRLDAPLSEGPDGALYGATYNGGSAGRGTVFKLNKDGSGYAILRHFQGTATDGGGNNQRVFAAADGTLYGANTFYGGDSAGLMFKLNSDGSGFTALKSFGAPDGSMPKSIMEASDGALYGVTYSGGGSNRGSVFKVNKDGSGFSVMHRFATNNDGAYPEGQLLEASDGLLYGTTLSGVPGSALFRVSKDGSGFTLVHTFAASEPSLLGSGVIEGSDGALYGTSMGGGTGGGYGTVYRINKDGTGLTILRSFANNSTDGNTPFGRLVDGPGGKLYGAGSAGGTANVGTVFVIGKDGSNFTVLHQFAGGTGDGATPYASLALASDGRLYGVASAGGAGGKGTVFGLNPDGSGYATLKNFAGGPSDGATPYYTGLAEKNGVLFGMTGAGGSFDGGTVFSLNFDGSGFTILINFGLNDADGRNPSIGLFKASDGQFYGTTHYGGNGGTVFRLRSN